MEHNKIVLSNVSNLFNLQYAVIEISSENEGEESDNVNYDNDDIRDIINLFDVKNRGQKSYIYIYILQFINL